MQKKEFDCAGRLQELIVDAELEQLAAERLARFSTYLEVFLRWNARVNLSAVRDAEGILQRHFLESIACAQMLPPGIDSLLDFGSGGGFPGIPIALCRPEVQVTLAESQGKKAAFLQEVVRQLGISVKVHAGRAEDLQESFDCVTLRAVDRMKKAVETAAELLNPGGYLALMTTALEADELQESAGMKFSWGSRQNLPGGEQRVLVVGQKPLIRP
jgi:16S rRNA (guanine527-N7)-methyltransferase